MQSHPAFAAKTFVGPTKRFSPLCPPLKTVPAWEAPRLWWNIFSTFEPAHTILTIQTLVEGLSAIFHFHFWQPFGSAKCSPCFWQISFTSMGPFFLQISCSIYFWISDVKSQQQYKFQKGLYIKQTKCSWMHSLRSDDRAKSDVTGSRMLNVKYFVTDGQNWSKCQIASLVKD